MALTALSRNWQRRVFSRVPVHNSGLLIHLGFRSRLTGISFWGFGEHGSLFRSVGRIGNVLGHSGTSVSGSADKYSLVHTSYQVYSIVQYSSLMRY